jgi:cell division protein FtsW
MLLVTGLFMTLLVYGLRYALCIKDRYAALAAFGLILTVIVQAMIHMQVVVQLAPPKGMPLPFLSHGGTSLIVSSFAIGVALGAARREVRPEPTSSTVAEPTTAA